eukprot:m.264744 g.264744  ORF g.264744 m.264744 type:complete len:257 (+) comp40478_c1_seq9:175-945(+)
MHFETNICCRPEHALFQKHATEHRLITCFSLSVLAWMFSLSVIMVGALSPVATYLCHRLGYRVVIMAGGFLFSFGTATSTLTTSAWQGVLLYGGVGGIGLACIYSQLLSLVSIYFDKYREIASGVTIAGLFLGPTVGSPVVRKVLDSFGLKGLAVLYGSIGLILVLTPLLFRPSSRYNSYENELFDMLRLLKSNPRLTLWIIVMTFGYLSLYVTSVHLVRYAECTLEVGSSQASLLLTYTCLQQLAQFSLGLLDLT